MQWYRAERMADIIKDINIPPNAWMGVTVESKRHGRDESRMFCSLHLRKS